MPALATTVPQEDTEAQTAATGPQWTGTLLGVGQSVNAGGAAGGQRQTRWTYRADLNAQLPIGRIGPADSQLFAHLRLGHGQGLSDLPNYASVNSTAGPRDFFATFITS